MAGGFGQTLNASGGHLLLMCSSTTQRIDFLAAFSTASLAAFATVSGKLNSVAVCLLIVLVSPMLASAANRIQIRVDSSEADQALAIIAKHNAGKDITDADWNAFFATGPYQRLKKRETTVHSDFTDDDFKKFLLSTQLDSQYHTLRRTLDEWKRADMKAAARRTLAYLPTSATVRTKVFPLIKPKLNSFVFDLDTDPAIFLYLDPTISKQAFASTVSHEMHHIGLSSTDKIYAATIASLPSAPKMAAEAMGAFGEGEAVLAAAGGPDVPPDQYEAVDVRQNWARGMQAFNQDLRTLNQFFLDVAQAKLTEGAANQKAMSFFGDIQGPWYTVGYKMASIVEKRFGRAALIQCMLDRRLLLVRYNRAAEELNKNTNEKLPLWSRQLLDLVRAPVPENAAAPR